MHLISEGLLTLAKLHIPKLTMSFGERLILPLCQPVTLWGTQLKSKLASREIFVPSLKSCS